jgi:hypothetical protein
VWISTTLGLHAVSGPHLVDVGVDEEGDRDLGVLEGLHNLADGVAVSRDVQATLGGELLAPLGHERAGVRLRLVGGLHHLLRRRHLQIELRLDRPPQYLEVALLDVPAVLAQVDGDLVRAPHLREHGGLDGVWIDGAARLAQGRDVIDVDAKASGHSGRNVPQRRTTRDPILRSRSRSRSRSRKLLSP